MHPRLSPWLVVVGVLVLPTSARAASQPIQIDGAFGEWTGAALATDPAGDDGSSGVDFLTLHLANDDARLFLRFDTTVEVQPDEQQEITLALDTDANAGTGLSIGSIGAELVWNLGQRVGTFYAGGSSFSIDHPDIGLFVGPTVSGTEFELALDRAAVPAGGQPLFPGNQVRVVLFDDAPGGDVFDGGGTYTFDATPVPVPSLGVGRIDPGHVRIASYNIQSDGLFNGGSQNAALDRLFDAIDPDVWVLNEVWNHNAGETASQVESFLPSPAGESWSAVKLDDGNVVVSRFPILDSWEVSPGDRITAVLLDPRPQLDTDLLVVANHWNCCTADDRRQEQADALIEFLHDARNPGGVITLTTDTPIVAAGDFNLVGLRGQLVTMTTGDIADNGTYGPDSPPDWDGSDLEDTNPRHPDARLGATWWNESSSFYPGKLDWMFYTDSVLDVQARFVLETRSMNGASLSAAGLNAGDTETGSDHAMIVGDFSAPSTIPVATPRTPGADLGGVRLANPAPNPFRGATSVAWSLSRGGPVQLTVHDVRGRLVARLANGAFAAGEHRAEWTGHDLHGREIPSGVYFVRLSTAGSEPQTRRLIVNR